MGNHLAHLYMSSMVPLVDTVSPRLEVTAPFFDQGCISVCGDALLVVGGNKPRYGKGGGKNLKRQHSQANKKYHK
jgi:hypothetical protein